MLTLITQSLLRRRVQTLATLLSVAVGAGILLTVFVIYQGVSSGVATSERRMGADLLVLPGDAPISNDQLLFTGEPVAIYMQQDVVGQVAKLPGVVRITAQFYAQSLNAACCSTASATRLIGYDPASDWLITSLVPATAQASTSADNIYVGADVQGFTGHDTFLLGKPVHIAAVLARTGTSLDQSIVMPMALTRQLAKAHVYYQHFWQYYGPPDTLVSAILIGVDPRTDMTALRRAILQMGDFRVIQSADVFHNLRAQIRVLFLLIAGIAALAVIASAFQLFARFFTLAHDRKGEWGLYRALGASRRDLQSLVMGEATVVTLGGTIAGLGLGGLLSWSAQRVLLAQDAFPYIPPSLALMATGVVTIIGLFALLGMAPAALAAHQSAAIDPSVAMALDDID
jgi:putative ABC transport system permease protein